MCTLKQYWSYSKYCEYIKLFFHFYLWVSCDWQEVERGVMRHRYENTQPRHNAIMRKQKPDWWAILLHWFTSILEIVFADMIRLASNSWYFLIWENLWRWSLSEWPSDYRDSHGVKITGPDLVGSVDWCASSNIMTLFESIAGTFFLHTAAFI